MKNLVTNTLVLSMLLVSYTSFAQILTGPEANPGKGATIVGSAWSSTDLEYDMDSELEVKRKIISADINYGITERLTALGQIGMISDAEAETEEDIKIEGGKGQLFGFGGKFQLTKSDSMQSYIYGMLLTTKEEYKDDVDYQGQTYTIKTDIELSDTIAGGVLVFKAGPEIDAFAGVEMVMNSDGDIKSKYELKNGNSKSESSKEDIERDGNMILKGGAAYRIDNVLLRAGLTFSGEKMFSFGATYRL